MYKNYFNKIKVISYFNLNKYIENMPQKKGWLTVQIREDVKNKLLELYNNDKKRPSNQKFTVI